MVFKYNKELQTRHNFKTSTKYLIMKKVAEILNEIDKYVPMFADIYGHDCEKAENALNEAKEAVVAREKILQK